MPRIRRIQSSFNAGVLDPRLAARIDVKAYYNGAETLDNVVCIPQGGVARRPGTKYIDTIPNVITRVTGQTITAPNGGTTANANDNDTATELITTTGISTTDPYVVVHYDLGSAKTIQFADVVGMHLTTSDNSEFFIQYSTDDITFTSVGSALTLESTDSTERRRAEITARYWRVARIGSTDLTTEVVTLDEFNLWEESATLSDTRLIPFSFSTEQEYMIVASDQNLAVYKDDALLVDVRFQATSAQLDRINWTQSADVLLIVHPDIAPQRIVRDTSAEGLWVVDDVPLQNVPKYTFADATGGTDEVQSIIFGGTWAANEFFRLSIGSIPATGDKPSEETTNTTYDIAYAGTTAQTALNIQTALRALSTTSSGGITVAHDTGTTYTVTFSGADGSKDWPQIKGAVVESTSGAIATTTVTEGISGEEDVWSSTRGWPLTITFAEGRLVFGGSKSRPHSIWMSVTHDFYNFDIGDGQPDEAIVATLDTDQVNEIRAVVPGRRLEIYTSGGEFIVPNTPMLPENFSVARQTKYGSSRLRNISIDGATIYVQRNGQGLREFLFSFTEDSHVSNSVSQLSSHLINSPVDLDAVRGTANEETNYIYVVNAAGDIVVLNTLREQEIAAWSGPWETASGLFKRVGILDFDAYVIVERAIDGASATYLEKLVDTIFTDCAITSASHSSATVTGLDHLEGETVKVKLGGAVQPDATVSSGQITLARTPSAETLEVGLGFDPEIKTMPVNDSYADGPTLNREKRIVKAEINRYQSLGILVNGERIPDRQFDVDTFDSVPSPSDEITEIYLNGWTKKAQVTITQEDPVPMTILGIDLEVSA